MEPSGGGTGPEEAKRQRERAKALGALDFLINFHAHRGIVSEMRPKAKEGEEGVAAAGADRPRILSWAHDERVHPIIQRAVIDEFMEEQLQRRQEFRSPGLTVKNTWSEQGCLIAGQH